MADCMSSPNLNWKTHKKEKIIRKSLNPKGEFFRRHQQKEMLSLTEISPYHLIVRIEKDESDHHEVIGSPADDECCNDDDRNSPA